jgi:hypothetical protein
MKGLLSVGVLAFFLPGVSGGAQGPAEHEAVMKDMIQSLSDMADILEGVKDKDSAKAAAPKLEAAAAKLEAVGKRAATLKEPSKEDQEKLMKKYGPELQKQTSRFTAAAASAGMKSGGDPDFIQAMKKLEEAGKSFQKPGGTDKKPDTDKK